MAPLKVAGTIEILENMKKNINYWKILTYAIYIVVIIFAFLAISSRFSIFGVKLFVVKSGSMEPTIKTGSVVINKSQDYYFNNDIITFKNKDKPLETTTHRVIDKAYEDPAFLFITQGDANNSPDTEKVTQDRIVGKVVFSIPYIGYIVSFTRTLPGLIILIIIPATIIVYDELLNIKREIAKRGKKKEENNG